MSEIHFEKRKTPKEGSLESAKVFRKTLIPQDYSKMVVEVFTNTFAEGLSILGQFLDEPFFDVNGYIYSDEIVLAVSLLSKGKISATTVYSSCDFDPKASSPSAEDLLGVSVDAIGGIYNEFFESGDAKKIEQLTSSTLSSFKEIPFDWTELTVNKRKVFLKVDKSNPKLDQMADDYLLQNDPNLKSEADKNEEDAEDLIVTGRPKKN